MTSLHLLGIITAMTHATFSDLRLALRLIARRPGFAAAVVATLALAIGAPTAIFSVVHAVLLRPLPYPDADRLVRFRMEGETPRGHVAFDAMPASTALQWGRDSATLDALALFNDRALTLSSDQGPFRLTGLSATPNLFQVLRVSPALGRGFDPALRDTRQVVLSDATWRRHFGGDPSVVGSTIVLDGDRYLVTGVMPATLAFPTPETAFWVPMIVDEGGTRGMLLPVIARVRDGATTAAVLDEGRRLVAAGGDGELRLEADTMQEQMTGGVRRLLWVLMAAVSVVFLIGSTNIALLLLTRGAGRQREFSVRLALGASRARLLAQLVAEVMVLAALGGAAGLALAAGALRALVRLAPADIPRLRDAALDPTVLAFTATLIILTGLVFGVLAARRALAADPAKSLGRLGGDAFSGRTSRRRLNTLSAVQLGLTMVLLVAAGLLLRSFVALSLADQGFREDGALAMQINLPASRYPGPAARIAFHERLLERLQQTPDVASAGIITMMPNRQPSARFIFSAVPVPQPFDPATAPVYETRTASEGFFEAMGIPLIAGRALQRSDGPGAERVVVISQRLAREQFPDGQAVGEILYTGMGDDYLVVGVVGDVKPAAPDAAISGAAYLPFRQDEMVFQWFATATLVVRSGHGSAAASVRSLVLSMDPEMPPFNVRTLDEEVGRLLAGPRFSATAIGIFAAVALALATLGVYAAMAYAAGLRTREIGVRIALGATRRTVLRLVLHDGLLVVATGLAAGTGAAVLLSRALTGLLHDVTPADPVALFSVACLLATAGIAAAYVPARRATRISVLAALRDE